MPVLVILVLYYKGRARHVRVHLQPSKAGTAQQSLKLDPAALSAEFANLEISDASDRVQSERREDIPGSFKYHGF